MEIDQTLDLRHENWLDRGAIIVATVMFTVLIVLVSIQVVLRTTNAPVTATWTEPMARYMFIVGTYLGAAIASRNNEHVRLTLVREQFLGDRERAQSVLDVVTALAMIAFVAVALWSSYRAMIQGWDTRALGGVGSLTTGHIYLGIFVGFALMGVYEAQNLVAAVRELLGSTTDQDQDVVDRDAAVDRPGGGE